MNRFCAPLCLLLAACAGSPNTPPEEPVDSSVERGEWTTPPPSKVDGAARVVAFADVHGDYAATVSVLQLAGLINAQNEWIGGETVAVQTGDQLDRGDGERAILDLFESLSQQAWDAGGAFYPLLGNHETMNVGLDFRYVTDGGWADFAAVKYDENAAYLAAYEESQRGRVAAFYPGGSYATILAGHNLAMMVGDTVFVHGGILPSHATTGLETINSDVQAWMRGETVEPNEWTHSDESPVWTRGYSDEPDDKDCAQLEEALTTLGAARMVVGHTIQVSANPVCNDKVWLLDVGMADYYGGSPAALEIKDDEVNILD